MKRYSALAPVLILILGCHSLNPPSENRSSYGVDIRQPTSKEEVVIFDKAVSKLPPEVVRAVKSFTVRSYKEDDHFDVSSVGHCSWDRHVCILSHFYQEGNIWHEIGHAYHFYLNFQGSDFIDRWRKVAGNPIKGAVSSYGATNYKEDIAEWYEHVQRFLNWQYSVFFQSEYRQLLKSDAIYRQKLELLWIYGFITEEQYHRILTF